ncbi:hypothetical protein, partial [Pseudomonas syringae group genomosp. 7]|uniref:hypothetical protein n=1 Tax=Pseudomonas syringae group genomosp. 7 TaxID=251699 RepID=UPI00376F93F0
FFVWVVVVLFLAGEGCIVGVVAYVVRVAVMNAFLFGLVELAVVLECCGIDYPQPRSPGGD